MKDSTITYITVGILILFGIGWFLLNPKVSDSPVPLDQKDEMTDDVLFPDEFQNDGQNDIITPSQQSQKPSTSNTKPGTLKPSPSESTKPMFVSTFTATAPSLSELFTLGTYYLKTINERGIDACQGHASVDDEDTDDEIIYTKENFILKKLVYNNHSVFMYVEASEVPEGLCATVVQRPRTNPYFSSINIIVQ